MNCKLERKFLKNILKKQNFSKDCFVSLLNFEEIFTYEPLNLKKNLKNENFYSNLSLGIFSKKFLDLSFLENSWNIFSNNSFEWKSLRNSKKLILRLLKSIYLKKKSNKKINVIEDCNLYYNFFKGILLGKLNNPNSIKLYKEILKYKNLDDIFLEIFIFAEFCKIQVKIFEESSGKLLIFGKEFEEKVHFFKSIDKKLWILADRNTIEFLEKNQIVESMKNEIFLTSKSDLYLEKINNKNLHKDFEENKSESFQKGGKVKVSEKNTINERSINLNSKFVESIDEEFFDCEFCFNEFKNEEIFTLNCSHRFCVHCIKSQLRFKVP